MDDLTSHAGSQSYGPEETMVGLHEWLVERALDGVSRSNGVLDLGCGSGAWLRRLRAAGFTSLTGLDWDATPTSDGEIRIVRGDLEVKDLGLGDQKFGLVSLVEVIEHMHNPGFVLSHAANHVRDDGVVLVTTPNIQSLIQRFKYLVTGRFGHFDDAANPTHYQPVLLDAWVRMLPRYGLKLDQRRTYPEANRFGGLNPIWRIAAMTTSFALPNPLPGESLVLRLVPTRRGS